MAYISKLNGYDIKDKESRNLINELSDKYSETKQFNKNVDIIRKGRFLDRYKHNNSTPKLACQCCTFRDDKYYLSGNLDSNNTNQSICVFDSVGNILNYNTYTQLGHANGITATANYLIVAPGMRNSLAVVDRDNLSYVKTISSIGTLRYIFSVSNYNEEIYFFGSDGNKSIIGKITSIDNETFEIVCTFEYKKNLTPQNFTVLDGYAYVLYVQSNMIYKIKLSNGITENVYNLPSGDGYFPSGEYEDIFKINNKIYLSSALYYDGSFFSNENSVRIVQIFETDLTGFIEKNSPYSYMQSESVVTLAVNGTGNYEFNPQNNFTTVEEACHIANYLKSAEITFYNTSEGYVKLMNGIYSLRGLNGTRSLDVIELDSANAIVSQVTGLGVLNSYFSKCTVRAVTVNKIIANWSDLELLTTTLANTTEITIQRSSIKYVDIVSLNSALVVSQSQPVSTLIKVHTTYLNYLMLLVKGTNRRGIIKVYRFGNLITTCMSENYANANSWNIPITNNTEYIALIYDGGILKLKKTDNTYENLSSSDVVEMEF